MARRRGTMRAQEPPVFTPIDPRSLPVPVGRAQTPQEMQDAVDSEARQRQTDEDVRRRARERGATPAPNRAPPASRRGGRVGVGVGAIFDPFELATDFGAVIGEEAGEALYGRTAEEQAEADRIEKELNRRIGEQERQLDEPFDIPKRMTPPPTPRGMEAYGRGPPVFGSERVIRPMPPVTIPPPAPKRSRVQRALHKVQSVTSNPWAQLGVFGLGLLGGRSSAPDDELAFSPAAIPIVSPEPFPNYGAVPFVQGMPSIGGPPVSRSATGACSCKPKRRGPKRRCLERAQVAWRSGRYKGKLAGTRCVRWE